MAKDKTPTSLLSFLYHIRYDEQVREDFHADEIATMERFGLSVEAQEIMREIGRQETGSPRGTLDAWKKLLDEHLAPELHDFRNIIW